MRAGRPGGREGSADQGWGIAGELLCPVSALGLHLRNQWTCRHEGAEMDGVGVRGVGVVGVLLGERSEAKLQSRRALRHASCRGSLLLLVTSSWDSFSPSLYSLAFNHDRQPHC